MAKQRKSKDERDAAAWEREQRLLNAFLERLSAVQSYEEARALYLATVPPDAPGRQFYSNLGFFLGNLVAPGGASRAELLEYIRLTTVFVAERTIDEESGVRIGGNLRKALSETWR